MSKDLIELLLAAAIAIVIILGAIYLVAVK
ncbi:hypothetical protein LCGC14_1149250 [marine sediment metagenome]|uniref:Uncharacterized protein n=1 Tax=marine sediment metagenome TaxID=412755 RepID=A0A0F9LW12_9ZZZZ